MVDVRGNGETISSRISGATTRTARPGRQQLRQLGGSDRSAADEQDGPSGQVQEQRQQISHKKQKGPGS